MQPPAGKLGSDGHRLKLPLNCTGSVTLNVSWFPVGRLKLEPKVKEPKKLPENEVNSG
jgi:hypothetical protein